MLNPTIPALIESMEKAGVPYKLVERLEKILYASQHNQMEGLVYALQTLLAETQFFVAPASTKYHGSKPFGLLEHSLAVTENLLSIRNAFAVDVFNSERPFQTHDCIIAGLLHDAGKAGIPGVPYYVQVGEKLEVNREIPFLTVAQRSLYLITNVCRFTLTPDQYQAILIHDGLYCDENRPYMKGACSLALLLHHADVMAAFIQGV